MVEINFSKKFNQNNPLKDVNLNKIFKINLKW